MEIYYIQAVVKWKELFCSSLFCVILTRVKLIRKFKETLYKCRRK